MEDDIDEGVGDAIIHSHSGRAVTSRSVLLLTEVLGKNLQPPVNSKVVNFPTAENLHQQFLRLDKNRVCTELRATSRRIFNEVMLR